MNRFIAVHLPPKGSDSIAVAQDGWPGDERQNIHALPRNRRLTKSSPRLSKTIWPRWGRLEWVHVFGRLQRETGSEYLKRIVSNAMRRLMFFIVAAGIPLVEAQAQIPADTLVTGQSQPARAQATPGGPWCFVGRGLSTALPDVATLTKLANWLGVTVGELLDSSQTSESILPQNTTPEIVEVHLRADKNLSPETANALAVMFKSLYNEFTGRNTKN